MHIDKINIKYTLETVSTLLLMIISANYGDTSSHILGQIRNGKFQQGKYMQSYVIKSFRNYGPKMCLRSCARYSGCNGVNCQQSPFLYCELLRVSTWSRLTDRNDFRYAELSTWVIGADACWPNPCVSQHQCVITYNGLPLCLIVPINLNGLQNVALGKPAYLSSQYGTAVASYGNDGNYDTSFHSGSSGNDYWYVDLGFVFDVHRVEFFNTEAAPYRLHNLDVTVGATLQYMQLCGHFAGPGLSKQHLVFICPVLLLGRFIKLAQPKDSSDAFLHLSEIEVYVLDPR